MDFTPFANMSAQGVISTVDCHPFQEFQQSELTSTNGHTEYAQLMSGVEQGLGVSATEELDTCVVNCMSLELDDINFMSGLLDDLTDYKPLNGSGLEAYVSNYVNKTHGLVMNANSAKVVAEKIMMQCGSILESIATEAITSLVNSGELWSMIRKHTHTVSSGVATLERVEQCTQVDFPPPIEIVHAPVAGNYPQTTTAVVPLTRPSRYSVKVVKRGSKDDTYFMESCYEYMTDNDDLIDIVSSGSDSDVLAITNFSNQGPTTKVKSDMALETKMFVDASLSLITDYQIMSRADLYRCLALMPDRLCLYCKKPSSKTTCMSGTFKCQNCTSSGGKVSFQEGFTKWVNAGFPVRHAEILNH